MISWLKERLIKGSESWLRGRHGLRAPLLAPPSINFFHFRGSQSNQQIKNLLFVDGLLSALPSPNQSHQSTNPFHINSQSEIDLWNWSGLMVDWMALLVLRRNETAHSQIKKNFILFSLFIHSFIPLGAQCPSALPFLSPARPLGRASWEKKRELNGLGLPSA